MSFGYYWIFGLIQLVFQAHVITCESRFIIVPESQTVIEGDSVTFSCHATPGLKYSWTLNGHPIQNSSRVHQVGSNLHVNDIVKDKDAGDYVCIAATSSSGARQASPPARLTVIWLKSASVQLLSTHKDEIILKCHVDGSGELEYEWFRNSEKLQDVHNIHFDRNRIIIRSPTLYDNGQYRCVATNSAGRVMSKKGYLLKWPLLSSQPCSNSNGSGTNKNKSNKSDQKQKFYLCRGKRDKSQKLNEITITQQPKKTVAKETEHVELHCKYNLPTKYKNNQIVLKWRKDGKIFRQVDLSAASATTSEPNMELIHREDNRVLVNRQNGSLIFNTVIPTDDGIYNCQIFVEGHEPITSEKAELSIIEVLKFTPQPSTSKNLELGTVGKIHCKAQGTPTPQIRWIQDNTEQLPETIDDINGTLIFKNVSSENKGNYTCIATNSQGQINATVNVQIVVAPKFAVAPEGPIQAVEMGVANFHCQAIGDPKPTIQWDKDLQYLSENNTDQNRFKFLENGTLQITEVHLDDEGRYGCTIGSSAGLKREEVRFIVKPSEGFTSEESGDGIRITRAVLITMSIAFAYIVLVVGLMLWCRYRRQARKARLNAANKDNVEIGVTDGPNGKNGEIEPCLGAEKSADSSGKANGTGGKSKKVNGNNNPKGSGNEAQKSDDTISSKGSKKSNIFDQLSVPRTSLSDLVQIGKGDFGDVFVGKIVSSVVKIIELNEKEKQKFEEKLTPENEKRRSKGSMDNIEEITEEEGSEIENEYKLVLVKALNKVKEENSCQEFKRQIEMFRAISHKGVAKLYGLCRDKDPHYLILEYTDWGDLKQFLLATAGKASTTSATIPALQKGQILAIAYQLARGMDAIYRARFIHKDLAARNCIISSDFVVKVSYPGLCKDKYSREYFKHRNSLLPIRWLAPECIQEDDYTTKSDIYAFGVLTWELFNQATKIPFEELSNEEFLLQSAGNLLKWSCAENTPDELKEILTTCWNQNPKERPSFSQLCSAFSKAMQTGDN
ncbi:tyrosine-protein kinase-like otk [Condylostylus longicornis]|uniref:tyrosine-protein kinase-like otk n=1 Tax=Condylostylus longicornis TaxID=2530218 RepID=UPI00244DDF5B|nr:tyrosine-protein kinase-like otk [Condylostylus longicornis]